jgi:hypothetical protein
VRGPRRTSIVKVGVIAAAAALASMSLAGCSSGGAGAQTSYLDGQTEGVKDADTDFGLALGNSVLFDCTPSNALDGRTIPSGDDLTQWAAGCVFGYNSEYSQRSAG